MKIKALMQRILGSLWWRVGRHVPYVRRLTLALHSRTPVVEWANITPLLGLSTIDQWRIVMKRSKRLAAKLKTGASSPRVVFIAPRGMEYDLVLQTCLAYRMMFDGAKCSFFICQDLPKCNQSDLGSGRPVDICRHCQNTNTQFLDTVGLDYLQVSDFVDSDRRAELRLLVNNLTYEECLAFEYREYPLGRILNIAASRYRLCAGMTGPDREEATEVHRDFLYGGLVLLDSYLALIAKEKPDVFVMVNGKLIWSAVAQAVAERHAIRTVSYEDIGAFFMGRTWVFAQGRPIMDLDFSSQWQQFKEVPLNHDEDLRLQEYLASRQRPGLFYREMERNLETIRAELGLSPNDRPVTMFSNVVWDSAALEKDVAFTGVRDWALQTVGHFINSGQTLILRVHPAEQTAFDGTQSREHVASIVRSEFGELPANIKIVESDSPISSYELIKLSGAAVVYTSTIGFEAVLEGIPAIVAGQAHYRDKGFTCDPDSPSKYFEMLNSLRHLTVSDEQLELARRYAYLYYFQLPLKLDFWTSDRPHHVKDLKFREINDLRPGKNSNLDTVAKGILHGVPILSARN